MLSESVPTDCILVTSGELLTTYTAFLNDDADKSADDSSDSDSGREADNSKDRQEPVGKKRKLFIEKKKNHKHEESSEDDALFFLLHGDQQKEFGLADALLSFVFAKNLPAEVLYDVLAVLLRKRDKLYSDALERPQQSDDQQEAGALVQLLTKHEREVCRRILLGILTLEENSSDEDDDEDGEGSAESYEDEDDDEDEE